MRLTKRGIAALLLAALGLGVLAGCGANGPKRPCLSSHDETYTWLMPMTVGKVTMFLPMTGVESVCDEWGPLPSATPKS